jgi:hypothetical protein
MCPPTTLEIPARFLGGVALQSNSMIYLVQLAHLSCPHLRLQTPALASTRGASHTVALPITLKSILRQKEELRKLKYFSIQKYSLPKLL